MHRASDIAELDAYRVILWRSQCQLNRINRVKVHSRLASDSERRLNTVHSGDTSAGCYGKPILNRACSTDATVYGSEYRDDPLLQTVATVNKKRRPAAGVEKCGRFRKDDTSFGGLIAEVREAHGHLAGCRGSHGGEGITGLWITPPAVRLHLRKRAHGQQKAMITRDDESPNAHLAEPQPRGTEFPNCFVELIETHTRFAGNVDLTTVDNDQSGATDRPLERRRFFVYHLVERELRASRSTNSIVHCPAPSLRIVHAKLAGREATEATAVATRGSCQSPTAGNGGQNIHSYLGDARQLGKSDRELRRRTWSCFKGGKKLLCHFEPQRIDDEIRGWPVVRHERLHNVVEKSPLLE
jgi:hypothetical protein